MAAPDDLAFAQFSRMVRMALHQLRNPLAGAYMGLDLLSTRLAKDSAEYGIARQARERLAFMTQLFDVLSEYAKPPPLRPAPVDLAALLHGLLDPDPPPGPWGRVDWQRPASPCPLTGDAAQLIGLFTRLLDNAAEATERQGRITVRLTHAAEVACVVLRDEGPGFDAKLAAHLGEPFPTTKQGNLGLGLAMARRIAAAHGGGVTFANAAPAGAIVEVTLRTLPAGGAAASGG